MTDKSKGRTRVLLLGGTTEARQLAELLSEDPNFDVIVSLAGRTSNPLSLPGTVRIGGFGGAEGLANFLINEKIDVLVDATHPFAAVISANAVAAADQSGVPLIALERPAWREGPRDRWHYAVTVEAALAALPQNPMRIFSGLGRLSLKDLEAAPHHHFVVRVIDPLQSELKLPNLTVITSRGPFKTEDDIALFKELRIEAVLAKNAGGEAARAKIDAARELGLPVYMIRRPPIPARDTVASIEDVIARLHDHRRLSLDRGV